MTTSTTTSSASTANKDHFFQTVTANEWGQVTGLEPHGQYVLLRRPTKELTKERSQQFMADVTAFLQQQRELTEKQARDLNEKYGAPAKAKAMEVREKVEKRFDELTKEFESRVEKLEHELGERADRIFAKAKPQGANGGNAGETSPASSSTGGHAETPGEMPSGHHEDEPSEGATTATSPASNDAKGNNRKKPARRDG